MRRRLAGLAALLFLLPLNAADPAPVEPGEDENAWQRLMAEDNDALVIINVQQILKSPMFLKGLKGKLPSVMSDQFIVPVRLKPLGVDPAKDLRKVTVMMARSDWDDKGGMADLDGGGVLLFHTSKSEAALRATLDKLAKDGKGVKVAEEEKQKFFEVNDDMGPRTFVAVLPGGTLALSPSKTGLARALARSKGPRKALKHAAMARFVAGLKPGLTIQGLLLPEAVIGASGSVTDNGMGMVKRESKLHTLGESGFGTCRFEATVKDTLKAKATFDLKDEATAEKKAKEVTGAVAAAQLFLGGQVMMEPKLKGVLKVLESVKVKADGKAVKVEGEVEAEAAAAIDIFDRGGGQPQPPAPPPPVEKR
jgi:hypothetical protein